MKFQKLVAILLAAFVMDTAHAESGAFVYNVTVEEKISPHSTQDLARQAALKKIQLLATQRAGSYIIKTEKLSDQVLTEEIEFVSASFVKLQDIQESLSLSNGQPILTVTANAHVDADEAKRRVAYMLENRQLRKELSRLNENFKPEGSLGQQSPQPSTALIATNQSSAEREFSSQEISALAAYSETQIALVANDIIESIHRHILNTAVSTAIVESVLLNNAGTHYVVSVRLGLAFDPVPLVQSLNKYWHANETLLQESKTVIADTTRPTGAISSSLSKAVLSRLYNNAIALSLSVNGEEKSIPITSFGRPGSANCQPSLKSSNSNFCITMINDRSDGPVLTNGQSNPVVFLVPAAPGHPAPHIHLKTWLSTPDPSRG